MSENSSPSEFAVALNATCPVFISVKIMSKLAFGYETEYPPDVVVYGTEVNLPFTY